jgi:hypothetical protein
VIVLIVVLVLCCCLVGAIGLAFAFGPDLMTELGLTGFLPILAGHL